MKRIRDPSIYNLNDLRYYNAKGEKGDFMERFKQLYKQWIQITSKYVLAILIFVLLLFVFNCIMAWLS